MKIVLNGCFGGYGLSYEAKALYLLARGKTPYFYQDISTYDNNCFKKQYQYKLISMSEAKNCTPYVYCTSTYQGEIINDQINDIISDSDISRTDPVLVSIVETIGPDAASGRFASLFIEEIPDGTLYKIDEYDGVESLITQDDDDWLVAEDNTIKTYLSSTIQSYWATMSDVEGK